MIFHDKNVGKCLSQPAQEETKRIECNMENCRTLEPLLKMY